MAVRNFWVEVEIDGRKTKLEGGPKPKEGGLKIRLYQRDYGEVTLAGYIECEATPEGTLITHAHFGGKNTRVLTKR